MLPCVPSGRRWSEPRRPPSPPRRAAPNTWRSQRVRLCFFAACSSPHYNRRALINKCTPDLLAYSFAMHILLLCMFGRAAAFRVQLISPVHMFATLFAIACCPLPPPSPSRRQAARVPDLGQDEARLDGGRQRSAARGGRREAAGRGAVSSFSRRGVSVFCAIRPFFLFQRVLVLK